MPPWLLAEKRNRGGFIAKSERETGGKTKALPNSAKAPNPPDNDLLGVLDHSW
jgi:hypothetical protein